MWQQHRAVRNSPILHSRRDKHVGSVSGWTLRIGKGDNLQSTADGTDTLVIRLTNDNISTYDSRQHRQHILHGRCPQPLYQLYAQQDTR